METHDVICVEGGVACARLMCLVCPAISTQLGHSVSCCLRTLCHNKDDQHDPPSLSRLGTGTVRVQSEAESRSFRFWYGFLYMLLFGACSSCWYVIGLWYWLL